ncbi:hypothetical protein D3C85_1898700 [compost metagenome]
MRSLGEVSGALKVLRRLAGVHVAGDLCTLGTGLAINHAKQIVSVRHDGEAR